jgi:hypothetical protein
MLPSQRGGSWLGPQKRGLDQSFKVLRSKDVQLQSNLFFEDICTALQLALGALLTFLGRGKQLG